MEQSSLVKIISNYGSRLWSMVSVFVFIPLYIKFLGSENYGLIGFYALLLGIISFADSGMSSAVIKEFSQESKTNYKYTLFRNLEIIYTILCVLISGIIFFSAEVIVKHWISSQTISQRDLVYYVRLIGVGVTTQLISSLYFGALFALKNQVRSNLLQLGWNFSKSALVFALFIIFSKSIELYFIWQIVCNVLYIYILRFFVLRQLNLEVSTTPLKILFRKLPKHIAKYIGGMIFIAIISSINIQADKLVTSSMFDLGTFGFYNIASSLAQIPVILIAPLIAFAFPLFSKFSNPIPKENGHKNLVVFNKIFYLTNLIAIVFTVGIFFYSKEILLLWTKSAIPTSIFPAIAFDVKILILGSFFLALQFPLYYLLLSKGKTKYTIFQGTIQVLVGIPLLYYCSKKFGLFGIPIPWLLINISAFVYLFIIVQKKFLDFANVHFYTRILLPPLIITLLFNFLVYSCYQKIQFGFIAFIAFSASISLIISVLYFNKQSKINVFSFKHLYSFPHE